MPEGDRDVGRVSHTALLAGVLSKPPAVSEGNTRATYWRHHQRLPSPHADNRDRRAVMYFPSRARTPGHTHTPRLAPHMQPPEGPNATAQPHTTTRGGGGPQADTAQLGRHWPGSSWQMRACQITRGDATWPETREEGTTAQQRPTGEDGQYSNDARGLVSSALMRWVALRNANGLSTPYNARC